MHVLNCVGASLQLQKCSAKIIFPMAFIPFYHELPSVQKEALASLIGMKHWA